MRIARLEYKGDVLEDALTKSWKEGRPPDNRIFASAFMIETYSTSHCPNPGRNGVLPKHLAFAEGLRENQHLLPPEYHIQMHTMYYVWTAGPHHVGQSIHLKPQHAHPSLSLSASPSENGILYLLTLSPSHFPQKKFRQHRFWQNFGNSFLLSPRSPVCARSIL